MKRVVKKTILKVKPYVPGKPIEEVKRELGLKDVKYEYTGGSRGWVGDSPLVHLSIEKIKNLGWQPKVSCEEGIRRTVRWLEKNKKMLR